MDIPALTTNIISQRQYFVDRCLRWCFWVTQYIHLFPSNPQGSDVAEAYGLVPNYNSAWRYYPENKQLHIQQ
jgi:hypothetical protein